MSIGSYFWNAYNTATTCLSDATTAMRNIRREDVAATAHKVKDATVGLIQNTAHHCGTAFEVLILQSSQRHLEREEKKEVGEAADESPVVTQMGESETEESIGETWQEVVIGAAQQGATPAPLAASLPELPIVRLPTGQLVKSITDHQDDLFGPRNRSSASRSVPTIEQAEARLTLGTKRSQIKQQAAFVKEAST